MSCRAKELSTVRRFFAIRAITISLSASNNLKQKDSAMGFLSSCHPVHFHISFLARYSYRLALSSIPSDGSSIALNITFVPTLNAL
jgi:hypothetical protein